MDQEVDRLINKGPLTRRRSGVVSTPERVLRSRGEKSDGSPPTSAASSRKESTPSRVGTPKLDGTPKRTLKKSTDTSTLTPSRRSARASSAQPEESLSSSKVSTRRRSSSLQPESPLKKNSTVKTRSKLSIDKSVAAVSTRSRKSVASSSTSPNSSNTSPEPVKEIKRITRRSESNSPAREVVSRATKTTRRSSLQKASDPSPVGSPDSETSSDKTPSQIPRKSVVKNLALSPVQEIRDDPLVIDSSTGASPKLASPSHTAGLPFVKESIIKVEPISPDHLTSNPDVNIKSESLSPNDSISNDKNESRAESEDSGIKEMEEFNPLEDKCVESNSEIFEDQNNDPNSKSNLDTMADRERLSNKKNVCNIPKYRSLDKGKIGNPVVSLVRMSPESIAESSGSKCDDGSKSGLDKLKKDLKSLSNVEKPKALGKKNTASAEEFSSNDKNLPQSDIPLIMITSVLGKDKPMNESLTDQLLTEIIEENNIKCTPVSKTSCQKNSLISGKSQEDKSEEVQALKSPKSLNDKPLNDSTVSEDLDFKLAIDNESPSDITVDGESMEENREGNVDKPESINLSNEENSGTVGKYINNSLKTDSSCVKEAGDATKDLPNPLSQTSGNSEVLSESVIPKDVINSSTPTNLSIDCSQQLNKTVTEFKSSEKVIFSDSSLHGVNDSLSESQIDTNYSILVNVSSDSIIDKTEEPKNSQDINVSLETSVNKSQLSARISDKKESFSEHFDYLPKDSSEESSEKKSCDSISRQLETSLDPEDSFFKKQNLDSGKEVLKRRSSGLFDKTISEIDTTQIEQYETSLSHTKNAALSEISDKDVDKSKEYEAFKGEKELTGKVKTEESSLKEDSSNKVTVTSQSDKEVSNTRVESDVSSEPVKKIRTHKEGNLQVGNDSSYENKSISKNMDQAATLETPEDGLLNKSTCVDIAIRDISDNRSLEGGDFDKNIPLDSISNNSNGIQSPKQNDDFEKTAASQDHSFTDSLECTSNQTKTKDSVEELTVDPPQEKSSADTLESSKDLPPSSEKVEGSNVDASKEKPAIEALESSQVPAESSETIEEPNVDDPEEKPAAEASESSHVPAESSETNGKTNVAPEEKPATETSESSHVPAETNEETIVAPEEKPATEASESSHVPAESSETNEETIVAPEEKPATDASESSHVPAESSETNEETIVAPEEKPATEASESSHVPAESSETNQETNVAPKEKPATEASESSQVPAETIEKSNVDDPEEKTATETSDSSQSPANIKLVSEAVKYSKDLSIITDSSNKSNINEKNVGSEEGLNNPLTTSARNDNSFFVNTSGIKLDINPDKCSNIEELIDANKSEAKSAPVGTLECSNDLLKSTDIDKESTGGNIYALSSGVLPQECPSLSPNIITIEKTAGQVANLTAAQVSKKTNDVTGNDSEETLSNSTLKSKEALRSSFAITGIFNETIDKVETNDTAKNTDSLLTQTDKEVDSIVGTLEKTSDKSYAKKTSLKEDVCDVKVQSNDCKGLSSGVCKVTTEQSNSTIDSSVISSANDHLLMNKSKSDPLHLHTLPVDSATSYEEHCPKTNSVRDNSNKSHFDLNSSSVSDKSLTSQNSTLEYQKSQVENSFEETLNVDVLSHQDMSVSEVTCSKRGDGLISSDSSKKVNIIDKEKSCLLIENVEVISDESMEPQPENAFTNKDQLNDAFNDTIVVSDSNHSNGSNDIITVNSSGDENREMLMTKEAIAESMSDNVCSTGSIQITQSTKNDGAIEGNETSVINQVELVSSAPADQNKTESHENLLKVDDELPSNKDEKSEIISSSSSSDNEVITGRDFLDDEAEEGEETDGESSDSSFKPSAIVHIQRVKRKVSSKKKRPFQISHTNSDNQSSSSDELSLVKSKKSKASWVVNRSEDISSSEQSNFISAGVNFTSDEGVQKKEKKKANVKCHMKDSKTKVPITSKKPIHAPINSIVESSFPINSCGTSWKVTKFTYNEKELKEWENKSYNFTGCGTEFKVSDCGQSYIKNRLAGNLNNSHAAGGIFKVQNVEDVKKLSRSLHSKKHCCNSHFMVKNWSPFENLASRPFSSGTIFEVTQDPASLKTKKRKANSKKTKTFESQLLPGENVENSGNKSSKKATVKSTVISESVKDHNLKHSSKKIKLDINMKSAGSAINVSRDPNLFIQNYNLGGGGKDSDSIILEMAFPPMKKCPVPCYSASILNLSTSFNAHDLYKFFSKHGINDIEEIDLTCPPRLFSQGIGFGTIRFSDEDTMQACIDLSFEKKLDGKELWMTPCVCYKPKSKKSSIWFAKTIKKFVEKERKMSFTECMGSD